MSFELPVPKTRKEYFMAIAAGGTPGEDFPARYEVAPVVEHVSHEYAVTLESKPVNSVYQYEKSISNFADPGDYVLTMAVKINGKNAERDSDSWVNEDGYYLTPIAQGKSDPPLWIVGIISETELSGAALNVTVETFWDDDSDAGTPLQPKTVEEAYYANLAEISVSTALSKMQVKSRKDQYLNALINGGDSNAQ